MRRRITGFRQDGEGAWIAELECGHARHVRHNPPWEDRSWVRSEEGRQSRLGEVLECHTCIDQTPAAEGSIAVRRATTEDAARIAKLSETLGYPIDTSDLVSRLERLLIRREDTVLVAESESGVIGWVHAAEQELLESGRRCEILGLVVDPAYRRRGVGRRLVDAVEQWAMSRALDQVSVRSNVTRLESHSFYQRLGYGRAKTQHAYRKRLPAAP
jgi:ribosomal protein S18 acetylase RimI-like enzyme